MPYSSRWYDFALVVIKLEKFNVILGIDWLSKYHVIVNYYTKEVVIEIPRQGKMVLVGERKTILACLISTTIAF